MHGLRTMAVRAKLLAFEAIGLDAAGLQREAGLDPGLLADPDAYVPAGTVHRLWGLALDAHGDLDLGLRMGGAVPPRCFGVIDYVVLSSPTVRAALEALSRYIPIVTTVERYGVELDDDEARLIWDVPVDEREFPALARDYVITLVVGRLRSLGPGGQPSRVRMRGGPCAGADAYPELLGCPVEFFARASTICLPRRGIELPVPGRDEQLRPVLVRHAEALLEDAPSGELIDRVRRETRCALERGETDVGSVARRLGMSARTLQRRLAECGLAFTDLLDRTRHDLALSYLRDPALSIDEIGFLLGYSERRAFTRAFRRWTGGTPAERRREQRRERASSRLERPEPPPPVQLRGTPQK